MSRGVELRRRRIGPAAMVGEQVKIVVEGEGERSFGREIDPGKFVLEAAFGARTGDDVRPTVARFVGPGTKEVSDVLARWRVSAGPYVGREVPGRPSNVETALFANFPTEGFPRRFAWIDRAFWHLQSVVFWALEDQELPVPTSDVRTRFLYVRRSVRIHSTTYTTKKA